MDAEVVAFLRATLAATVAPDARLVAACERAGEQGYSGATLRYYDVEYALGAARGTAALVTKDAWSIERRALSWLGARGLPVPRSYCPDLASDAPALVGMEYLGEIPARDARAREAAGALAAIHRTALGRGDELPWLPRADPAWLADWIVGACWRRGWASVLAGEGHVDAHGRAFGPPRSGGAFAATFAADTPAIEAAAARFLRDMGALWADGAALTLIHADFHGEHLRAGGGRAAILDWGQARYGPLYLDLPNFFSRDEALGYRDALAELGHDIPRAAFLAGYDAARPYVGFKYFGLGLWNWCYGEPPHGEGHVRKWIGLVTGEDE